MGGTTDSPRGADGQPARADAQHWRALAVEREAQLRDLRRRPLVRIALRLDRHAAWLRGPFRRLRAATRRTADGIIVAAAAAAAAPHRRRRRDAIARELGRLEAVPHGRRAGLIGPGPRGADDPGLLHTLADGARDAHEDVLCFLPAGEAPDPAWLPRLVAAIDDGAVAATPTLLHPDHVGRPATEHDLLVRSAGIAIELDRRGGPVAIARDAGTAPDTSGPSRPVAAAPMTCLVVRRDAYVAAGGLERTLTLGAGGVDVAAIDLCLRLRRAGGEVVHVPSALAFDGRPVRTRPALRHPVDPGSAPWRWLVDREGPALRAEAQPAGARSWMITTSVPSPKIATRWGDWHFAEALARSLRSLGEVATVETHPDADSTAARSADIHLVLRGLAPVRRTPGQRHVLWVISHPERVEARECDEADLVLVASERFAEELRRRTATPVEVLLQATDHHRFQPGEVDPAHQHAVTVVAKTRDVVRPAVTDALAAGLRPSIYGSGWEGLVDPELIVADRVANEDLPAVYRSAGVVLNDHWDTMRAWGFLSNRLFDVLACGTPIISDPVDGLDDVFHGAVLTYRTPTELADLVGCTMSHPDASRARAAEGRAEVLAHHTFDHRARTLLELMEHHGLATTRNGTTHE